jgi:AraC-like DNA-binding protein
VLVLTGFGDVESAVAARRFGAAYRRKPLIGDDLVDAVRAVLQRRRRPAVSPVDPEASDARIRKNLLERLESVGFSSRRAPAFLHRTPTFIDETRLVVLGGFADALLERDISVYLFLACVSCVRQVLIGPAAAWPREPTLQLKNLIEEVPSHALVPAPANVREALAWLEALIRSGVRPTEQRIADEIDLDRSHLGRLVHKHTGLYFEEWRRALTMRLAVPAVVLTVEQMAQIAHVKLGYEHPSQFGNEFRDLFGVSPGEFRRVCRVAGVRRDAFHGR